MFYLPIQGKPNKKDKFTNAMLAKIRHFVTWIALADSLLTLMYNYLV